MLVTGLATEFQCPRGFPQIHTTISELASQYSLLCAKPAQSFPFAKGGSVAPWQVYSWQFPFWCCIEKENFMQAKGSCARVPDRTRDSGWVVSKTQVSTGTHKAPDWNDCMATDLNEYTQSTFFLHMCMWGTKEWGVKITYLRKGKLWEKQVCNLGFSQKTPAEFPLFAFNYQPQKTIA